LRHSVYRCTVENEQIIILRKRKRISVVGGSEAESSEKRNS
jgi:hypothetical protein